MIDYARLIFTVLIPTKLIDEGRVGVPFSVNLRSLLGQKLGRTPFKAV